jgi:TrmH family RNA methyltransferase
MTTVSTILTQRDRKHLEQARTRHGRRKLQLTLCEGFRCCREALSSRPDSIELLVCDETFAASEDFTRSAPLLEALVRPPVVLPPREFAGLAVTDNPQGILCLAAIKIEDLGQSAPPDPFVLILDRLAEPGNIGTILRTAWAIGLHEVWLTQGTADPFNPKAIRAGMGAQFGLTLRQGADLPTMREHLSAHDYPTLWLTVPKGGISLFSDEFVLPRSGMVIGNEANGVGECPGAARVSIPMPGQAESLNAAQAATVFLVESVRRGILSEPM